MVLQRSLEFASELVFSDGRVARTPQDISRIWQDELLRKELIHHFYEGELIQWLRLIGREKDASRLELLRDRHPEVGEVLKELEALFLNVPQLVSYQPEAQLESPPPLKIDLIEQQRGIIRWFMETDGEYYKDICRLNESLFVQKTLLNHEMNNQTLRLQRSMDEVDKILATAKTTLKDLDITWPAPASEEPGSMGYQASAGSEADLVLDAVSSDFTASVRELESFRKSEKERLLLEERQRQEEEARKAREILQTAQKQISFFKTASSITGLIMYGLVLMHYIGNGFGNTVGVLLYCGAGVFLSLVGMATTEQLKENVIYKNRKLGSIAVACWGLPLLGVITRLIYPWSIWSGWWIIVFGGVGLIVLFFVIYDEENYNEYDTESHQERDS